MTYNDQWKALSARIRGLMQAAELHARFLAVRSSDTFKAGARLREQIEGILSALQTFEDSFQDTLPPAARTTVRGFVERIGPLIRDNSGGPGSKKERVWALLVLLGAFETEMSFTLSDIQQSIRARSERAFSHLQRSIVVDPTFREKWQVAFSDGEPACEKLGAVHLLLHGIWAFKVGAEGERTDLVYQEPAGELRDEQRYVDGLVLTEWKRALPEENHMRKFDEARSQAQLYAQGALAGIELTAIRYAVVVSQQRVTEPSDLDEGGVVYRHINIAVDPQPPSRAVRSGA